jgi:hypothetical protein
MSAFQSPKDYRDWSFEQVACGETNILPDEYSHQSLTQPARDQGIRSTCVAFVGATICEVLRKRDYGDDAHLSPEFIYFHRDNKPASGMYGRNLFKILHKIGTVPEDHFPYQVDEVEIEKPSNGLYKFASEYRISAYARVKTINGLQRAIYEVGPAYLLLPLYETRPRFWLPGKLDVSGEYGLGHDITGSHAVAVVGYTREGFILKNSWGHNWNGDGTILFKYKYWSCIIECWVPFRATESKTSRKLSDARVIEIPRRRKDSISRRAIGSLLFGDASMRRHSMDDTASREENTLVQRSVSEISNNHGVDEALKSPQVSMASAEDSGEVVVNAVASNDVSNTVSNAVSKDVSKDVNSVASNDANNASSNVNIPAGGADEEAGINLSPRGEVRAKRREKNCIIL